MGIATEMAADAVIALLGGHGDDFGGKAHVFGQLTLIEFALYLIDF